MSGQDGYALTAELYDSVVPYRERPDVSFFVEAARASGGPVLEVGCGTGRVLIPTARAGIEITGMDLSQEMLSVCQHRLEAESAEVRSRTRLVRADMRSFAISKTFRLVTLPFRPFQHLLTVPDQIACLDCLRNHLEQDGRLILDVFNPSLEVLTRENIGEVVAEEPEFVMPDGRRVIRRHKIVSRDIFNQIHCVELIYDLTFPDGHQERRIHSLEMRYFFRFEAEHLLARCGFDVDQVYADYDKSPFGSKNPGELIFIAKKK